MRRFFGFLLTMALLGGGVFWLPYLQAEPVDNVYQAADLLRQDAENGGNGVDFREDNVDADEVYRALEAQYPYAFALHRGNTAEQDHRAERRGFSAWRGRSRRGSMPRCWQLVDLTAHARPRRNCVRCTIPSSASASTMWIRQRRTLRTARHPLCGRRRAARS